MIKKYKKTKAQIFNFQEWINIYDPEILKKTFQKKLEESGFGIISFSEHYFPKKGYTCFWLLSESHLAIHTFPEENKTYIELSSCNESKLKIFKTL